MTFPCYQPFDQDIFIHKLANARTVVVTLKGDPGAHQILFYKSNGVHSKEDLQTHGVPAPPLVLPKNFSKKGLKVFFGTKKGRNDFRTDSRGPTPLYIPDSQEIFDWHSDLTKVYSFKNEIELFTSLHIAFVSQG